MLEEVSTSAEATTAPCQADPDASTPRSPQLRPLRYRLHAVPRCYNCGVVGHLSYACERPPNWQACYNCDEPGHISRDCTKERKPQICYRCMQHGHVANVCSAFTASYFEPAQPLNVPDGFPVFSYADSKQEQSSTAAVEKTDEEKQKSSLVEE